MIDWIRRLFQIKTEIDPPPADPDFDCIENLAKPWIHPFIVHRERCRQCQGLDPCPIGRELLK